MSSSSLNSKQIDQILAENDAFLKSIQEFQSMGKVSEVSEFQKRLQSNLLHLVDSISTQFKTTKENPQSAEMVQKYSSSTNSESTSGNVLKALINDLELSFSKVEVIHETQFNNAAVFAGMSPELADELSLNIGLRNAANHELPAVVVIKKLKDQITSSIVSQGTDEPANSPKAEEILAKTPESVPVTTSSTISRFDSFVDMNMIKISPNGYAGNFLDRHLVYTIEDQNRVINLERGNTRTCQVTRRFSDFVAVQNYLLVKYPFRCIPKLPAKRVQVFTDEGFLLDRQKSLRRYLGFIAHHHIYKTDSLVQAFIHSQKEYVNLISDQKFTAPDREHMLLTQIPSADALVDANRSESVKAVEKSRIDSQTITNFCIQIRDQVKGLIDTISHESNRVSALSSILAKAEDVTACFCGERCENCVEDQEERKKLSSKLKAVNETTESVTIIEYEEIVERINLMIDLIESFNELTQRVKSSKYSDFDEIRREIGILENEIEKKRASSSEGSAEMIDRLQGRIDSLKHQWDEQDTYNKFIQYSVYDEMKWIHDHKVILKRLLDQLTLTMTLKQRQWIAIFES